MRGMRMAPEAEITIEQVEAALADMSKPNAKILNNYYKQETKKTSENGKGKLLSKGCLCTPSERESLYEDFKVWFAEQTNSDEQTTD